MERGAGLVFFEALREGGGPLAARPLCPGAARGSRPQYPSARSAHAPVASKASTVALSGLSGAGMDMSIMLLGALYM